MERYEPPPFPRCCFVVLTLRYGKTFLFFEKPIPAVLDGFQGGVMRNEKRWQILLKFDLKRGGVECGGHTEEEKAGEEDIINYFTHIQACRCMLVW